MPKKEDQRHHGKQKSYNPLNPDINQNQKVQNKKVSEHINSFDNRKGFQIDSFENNIKNLNENFKGSKT